VARFTFALSMKASWPAMTWAAVSQQAGYFDQMHLVKDFKALAAAPPSTLLHQLGPQPTEFIQFPDLVPAAALESKSVSY
jgi:hypothetical protein